MTLGPNQSKKGTPNARSANPMNIKGDKNFESTNSLAHNASKATNARSDHTPKERSANRMKRAGAEVTGQAERGYVKNEAKGPKSPVVNVSARKNRKLKD